PTLFRSLSVVGAGASCASISAASITWCSADRARSSMAWRSRATTSCMRSTWRRVSCCGSRSMREAIHRRLRQGTDVPCHIRPDGLLLLLALQLAQESLEETQMRFLVAEDLDHHVLRHVVQVLAELDDAAVVIDRALLRLDHSLDHVHDVGLHIGGLQEILGRLELQ